MLIWHVSILKAGDISFFCKNRYKKTKQCENGER